YTKQFNSFDYLSSLLIVFTYTFSIYIANSLVLSDYYLNRKKNIKNILTGGLLVNLLTIIVVFVINIIGNLIYNNFEIVETLKSSFRQAVFSSWFSMTISTTVYIVL